MVKIVFKAGSTPHKLHTHFSSGKSITYDEAYAMEIRNAAQRIHDLHKKFTDAGATSPLMVIDEANGRGGVHARYFYKGYGCHLESKEGARMY